MANTKGTSVINTPSSGGAQSGLGEKFSPDLFTGTGNFSVPIAVPPGRNGFQPELTLGYSSGNGNGAFGMGWALGIPGVTRKTSKGIPIYEDKSDIFILSGAEDLVPVKIEQEVITVGSDKIGWERTFYRPRTEGLFAKIIRHKKTNGEHYWEVRSKDGLISWYGTPGATPSANSGTGDPAIIANPENRNSIFSWHLTKTEDPFGNVILYNYLRTLVIDPKGRSYDQIYLDNILYAQYPDPGPPAGIKYLCEVRFVYEERPDPFSVYKQGFEIRMTQRCIQVETYTHAIAETKTKTYHFKYLADLPLNGASLLESVSVEGHPAIGSSEESEFMPPLAFTYSEFNPLKRGLQEIKGPIPATLLSEPGYELVDVTGNGIPDLLQLSGTARYWTNKGNGEFSQPKNLGISPSLSTSFSNNAEGSGLKGLAFIDANGDGRTDLMVMNGITTGYFPGAFQKVWDEKSFRTYQQTPSFSLDDPEVQLMDLDGDGITDVLRNGSKFECFYNNPEKGFYKVRTAIKTFADFSFSDPRIRFADMTGDGLQDIVLISSGRVQYWPNMGYGRFGAKVNMKNAPSFPEQYDPAQVLLGDLDGDGQTDIAFVENNSVTISINQSGNSFCDPVKIINTPSVRNPKAIRIVDILGTGQAGILWTLGGSSGTGVFFLDFTASAGSASNKPYVLEQMNNNMGSLTRVSYGSSVYHFLRDQKQLATRWKTNLPFPVQVVNRVEVYDFLSGGKLVTEYNYHNGYWDGVEREFRGFAHVDNTDTETFDQYNLQDLFKEEKVNTVSSQHYSAPTMTKSWFYVGPVGDGFSRWKEPDFSDEYWSGDVNVLKRSPEMLAVLAALPRRARRDALRTFRGSLLRSELYALDGSVLKDIPYTVTESLMSLRKPEFDPATLPDPLWSEKSGYWSGGGYVFFPFNIAQRTTQYERGIDPMHSFSFTKDYDEYGQAQGQLSVGVPRGLTPAAGMVHYSGPFKGVPEKYLCTYTLGEYIYKNVSGGLYMVNRTKRGRSWDLTQGSSGKDIFELRDEAFDNYESYPLISCSLNYYDGTAFLGENYGIIQDTGYGAQVRSETLIVTDTIIADAYTATPQCFKSSPNWSSGYPTTFAGALQNGDDRLGYKDRRSGYPNHEPGWYAESARVKYDFQVTGPELPQSEQLGRVLQSRDVFDAWSEIEYDDYLMMAVKSIQYLDLYPTDTNKIETEVVYDYRVMQPFEVTDPNLNKSVFDFSPLGLLRATALIGKGTEGDYKSASGDFYAKYEPSVRMEYDFFAFVTTQDPVWVKTISRELHYQQSASSPTIIKVEYSDGFGRLLQTRVQAEDVIFGASTSSATSFGSSGLPIDQDLNAPAIAIDRGGSGLMNVVVSGWKIYNNKGKIVEQYEPFFDKGFDFSTPLEVAPGTLVFASVRVKMFYDPLGRVVKTNNPDSSQQWVIYGIPKKLNEPYDPSAPAVSQGDAEKCLPTPWVNFTYDANDLADLPDVTNTNVPATHFYTPKSAEVDALGRTIRTIDYFDNASWAYTNYIEMSYFYDVRGNLLLVKDPYNRNVFEHVYDLRQLQKGEDGKEEPLPPLWTKHIDKGENTVLFDVTGKPVESFDAKDAHALSAFDIISRPIYSWASNDGSGTITLRSKMIYGEGFGSPTDNLNGKVYQSYDEAGLVETPLYDFKSNLLSKSRSVINDSVLQGSLNTYTTFIIDWDSPPLLSAAVYTTDMTYDALNRITELTLPTDLDAERKKIIPTYNNAGALEKVDLYSSAGGGTTTNYVENIAYNAKGQRLLIAFGNDVMTRYTYDILTFRLLRQRSEKYTKNSVGDTITYNYAVSSLRQDDGFNYDLVGNIVKLLDRMTDCGIGGTPDKLVRDFEYDPLYRLTYANGRESDTQGGNSYLYEDAPAPAGLGNVRAYQRTYEYDKLGNILNVVQDGIYGFTRHYEYTSGKNTLEEINDGGGTPSLMEDFTYDANGNQITSSSTRNYVWNYADQLICYYNQAGGGDPTVFTQYDYAGQDRVSKLVRTGTSGSPIYERTIYIDGIFEYVKLENGSTYEKNYIHLMDDKSRIAEVRIGDVFPGDISDNEVYIIENQIGSSVMRIDASGDEIDREEYYPFGDSSLRTFVYKRYRYVGKERDAESGLYYYGARYYAAWTCRFISVDPLVAAYPFYSPYQYSGNNPINFIDLDGNEPTHPKSIKEFLNRSETNLKKTDQALGFNKTSGNTFHVFNLFKLNKFFEKNTEAMKSPLNKQAGTQFSDKYCYYDCITSAIIGLRILTDDYKIKMSSDPALGGTTYSSEKKYLESKGMVSQQLPFEFIPITNKSGTTVPLGLKSNLGQQLIDSTKNEEGLHVFLGQIGGGWHAYIVTLIVNKDENGKTSYTFHLFEDENYKNGVAFNSTQEFNKAIGEFFLWFGTQDPNNMDPEHYTPKTGDSGNIVPYNGELIKIQKQ